MPLLNQTTELFKNLTISQNQHSEQLTYPEQMFILNTRVFVYGYLLFPLAVIGVILNSFTILVLLHPRLRSFSTNAYLTALSLANIVCLANFIFLYSLRYIISYKMFQRAILTQMNHTSLSNQLNEINQLESFINLVYGVWSPIFTTFQLYTFYLTCAVTVDRWIYVTWPLKADKICKLKNTFIVIGIIFLFCFVYNLPRWFEIESYKVTKSVTNQTYYQARLTNFGKTRMFNEIMRRYGYFIFVYGLPFIVLVIVNIGIAQKLIEAKRRKKRLLGPQKGTSIAKKINCGVNQNRNENINAQEPLLNSSSKAEASKPESEEMKIVLAEQQETPAKKYTKISEKFSRTIVNNVITKKPSIKIDTRITFMVITVVVAFFLCQFPYLVVNLLAASSSNKKWFHLSKVGCDFLTAFNCCINFFIYCMFGQKFREIAKGILLHPSFSPYSNVNTIKNQQTKSNFQSCTAIRKTGTNSQTS